jgi:hypothetical protein
MAELERLPADERTKKQKEAVGKVRMELQAREKMKSMRTRRRAREVFTNLKATGKIPKDAKFSDLSDKKFFGAAKDIEESELKRSMIQHYRDLNEAQLRKTRKEPLKRKP